jgi:hypothetical protein
MRFRLIRNEKHLPVSCKEWHPLRILAQHASNVGFNFSPVGDEGGLSPVLRLRKGALYRINNKLCHVLHAGKVYRGSEAVRQPYVRVRFVREILDAVEYAVVIADPVHYAFGIYIYPSQIVLDAYFSKVSTREGYVIIPITNQSVYKNRRPRLRHWEDHRFAWHLLN